MSALIEAAWIELALRKEEGNAGALPTEVAATLRKRIRSSLELAAPPAKLPEPALALMTVVRCYPSRGAGLFGLEIHYTPLSTKMRLSVNAEALFGQYRASG